MSDTIDTVEHKEKAGRNTNIVAPLRSRNWVFTLNNYSEIEVTQLTEQFSKISEGYIFQEEKGTEGTKHLQGLATFKNARSLRSMKKINSRAHWEVCKNKIASIKYCQKKETRAGRIWCSKPEWMEEEKREVERIPSSAEMREEADIRMKTEIMYWSSLGEEPIVGYNRIPHDKRLVYRSMVTDRPEPDFWVCDD